MYREVIVFKNYFYDFYELLPDKAKQKTDYVLDMISFMERVPEKYFKHIEGTRGLYEIRVKQGGNAYRIFCCFDKEKLIVLFNGFVKKTQKTPQKEIIKAEKIKEEYFREKQKNAK